MLRNNKNFLFNGPMRAEKTASMVKKYDYAADIIISGPDSVDIIRALGCNCEYGSAPCLTHIEHGKSDTMYAVRYYSYGQLNISVNAKMTSDVQYSESPAKLAAKQFEHNDHPDTRSSFTRLSQFESFERINSDSISKSVMVVVATHRDNHESSRIADVLNQGLSSKEITSCNIFVPNVAGNDQLPRKRPDLYSPIKNTVYHPMDDYSANMIANLLRDSLRESENNYIKSLVKDVEKELQNEMITQFKNTLHEQADEHFAEKRRKSKCGIL